MIESQRIPGPCELPLFNAACQVAEITPLSHDVTRVMLQPLAGEPVAYHPGQYLEIILSAKVRCAYSIACAPREDGLLELHVRAVPSENYLELAGKLVVGETLHIEMPKGDVFLKPASASSPVLLLAGSTGFSQAKAVLEQWMALGYPRPLHLYWGGRRREDLYLHDWLTNLAQQHAQLHYVPVLSENNAGWQGRTGLVHKAVLVDFESFADLTVLGCGSPPMVYAALDDFIAAGMSAEQLLSDVFAYAPR